MVANVGLLASQLAGHGTSLGPLRKFINQARSTATWDEAVTQFRHINFRNSQQRSFILLYMHHSYIQIRTEITSASVLIRAILPLAINFVSKLGEII
jgi:hypothetical protein